MYTLPVSVVKLPLDILLTDTEVEVLLFVVETYHSDVSADMMLIALPDLGK